MWGHHPSIFCYHPCIRTVAFKAEDISRRLTPNELKERITLEQSIQNDVCCGWSLLWVESVVGGGCCEWSLLWVESVVSGGCCEWGLL